MTLSSVTAFLLASGLALLGGASGALMLRLPRRLDTLLAAATFAAAQIVVSLLIPGAAFRRLDDTTVLAADAALAVILAVSAWSAGCRVTFSGRGPSPANLRLRPWEAVLVALAGAALVWRLLVAYVLPPYAYDALSYHLPTVMTWLQQREIADSPLNSCCAHYPANGELMFMWPALLLRDATFVDSVQVGFAVLGAAAVAGLATVVGVGRAGAVVAGSLFVLMPVVLAQASTNYVDLISSSTFLVALYFTLRAFQERSPRRLLLAGGIAAALCLGTKPDSVIAVGVLALAVLTRFAADVSKRRLDGRALLLGMFAFLLPLVLLGGFWYVRNWVRFGNPFDPFEVRVFGLELFGGSRKFGNRVTAPPSELLGHATFVKPLISWARDLLFWKNHSYTFDQRLGGFGPFWSYLAAPLLGVFSLSSLRRNRASLHFLWPVFLIFLVHPYRWWSRFTISFAAVAIVALAFFLWSWRDQVRGRLLSVATVVLVCAGLWISTARVDPGLHAHAVSAGRILHLATKPSKQRTLGRIFFPDYRWVDDIPARATIAVDDYRLHLVGALGGQQFDRRVLSLRQVPPDRLLTIVRAERIDYVALGRSGALDRVAASRGTGLLLISVGPHTHVYRVLRP